MANSVIGAYTAAATIDGSTHYLLIQPGNSATAYNRINRNVFLGVTGQPMDISTSQNVTNKTLNNTNILTVRDDRFTIQDDGDTTKQAQFNLIGITTGTTRTYTLPNASSTLADISSTQTFTNKALTSPVITNGSITGSTITNDAIVGQTSATSGTVYGLSIASGKIGTNGVVAASITDGAVTPAKLVAASGTTWVNQTWTPTITGFSVNPAGGLYYYSQTGKLVTLFITQPTAGTSNSTAFTISLPITARTIANAFWSGSGQIQDNGTVSAAPGLLFISSAGTTLNLSKDFSGGSWTAAGNKRLIFGTITYEVA